ncbi:AcrR family transcriptional regulator [Catenulispora sp. EB89]|uniref:TetR/AcrR family transcriptional regulator n=1 Tax=Catenulispora sp. EB89 TaxID=3156257 RepID=UPI003518C1D3
MTTRTPRTSARRDQLTAIAAGLFARDGYHNVTVGDIAAAAGLSGPAIYRHFPGKQAILAEVVRSGFDEMARVVAADLAGTSDPAERLRRTYRDLAAFVIRRPEFGVMWRREYRHLAPDDAAELAKRMGQASDAAVAELRLLRPELEPADAELVSWAAMSVMGSISDHRVRLPRAAFEELLAGIAMDVAAVEFGEVEEDDRPDEPATGDRKELILAAAARLFWDRGYHEVTLDEIGAAAGIAGPSVYSHFAGKAELLRTITERIGERLRRDLADSAAAMAAGAARESVVASAAEPHQSAAAAEPAAAHDTAALAALTALTDLATRYVTTVLTSRDLVAAYFTEGHNLPDRDRAETRRFQRAYAAHWAALLASTDPAASAEEIRIRVLAAFAVVNDTARTRRLLERPGLAARLRGLMLAVLLTPVGRARDVNRR